jgi:hypothetical protein
MGRMFFAKKSGCASGHTHDSRAEAKRCDALHQAQERGEITSLRVSPEFDFIINGLPVKMANGHKMKFTADFEYIKVGGWIVEDVKPKGGFDNKSRDVPVKLALLRHLYPHITWQLIR